MKVFFILLIIWSSIGIMVLIIDCKILKGKVTIGDFIKDFFMGIFMGIFAIIILINHLLKNYKWQFWNKKLF